MTGVQTCALPISGGPMPSKKLARSMGLERLGFVGLSSVFLCAILVISLKLLTVQTVNSYLEVQIVSQRGDGLCRQIIF